MIKNNTADLTRVFEILFYQEDKYPQLKALNKIINGVWKAYSTEELILRTNALSCWLIDSEYKKGDHIAIIPENGSPEWMIFDFACQQVGLVTVPVHPTASVEEIKYILRETDVKFCLTANSGLFYKVKPIAESINADIKIKHLERDKSGYFSAIELRKATKEQISELDKIKSQIKSDDVFVIMYTSGTSGIPKGVMLTHRNVLSNILSILTVFPLEHSVKVISFLPFSHILERTAAYAYIAFGVSVFFSQSKESFTHDFQKVKPYFCTMVPRILEKMYDHVHLQTLGKNPLKKIIIKSAFNLAKKYSSFEKKNVFYRIGLFFARIFVFNRWRKALGGKIKYMAVGAAALRPEISRSFSAANIRIREGYGMTETSPVISMNRFKPGMNRFGTVGIPVPGVQVKIDTDLEGKEGEILVKGPNVMQGYYKQADLSKEAFTSDGWFKTGDVGKFIDKKFLKITDRKKDIFKTSTGKYIAPQVLENYFVSSPVIQQCHIIGFQKPFVTALIVANFLLLEKWCATEGIHWTAPQFMVYNIKVRAYIQKEIDKLNTELPSYRRIKKFVLCREEWTVETKELTSSYKPIRNVLLNNFKKEIDKMYE